MRVLVDALGIQKPGGGRTSILNLFQSLIKLEPDNNYLFLLSKEEPSLKSSIENVQQLIVPFANRFISRIWAQSVIPIYAHRYDLVHFTKNLIVAGITVPKIITIHDLTILLYPQHFPSSDVFYWKTIEKWSARSADLIIAVSKSTANDLGKFYNIPPTKIRVIHHGLADNFWDHHDSQGENSKKKYALPPHYLLYVGRIDVRKNLPNLVKAFEIVRRKIKYGGKLVIVGEEYKKCPDRNLIPTIQSLGLQDFVIFTGPVPDEDLPGIYSGADAFVLPSLHEGFGLVTLEAMACHVPVITHSADGIKEVTGDAAFLVDASQADILAEGIISILQDSVLRNSLIHQGIARAKCFHWDNTARETLKTYHEVTGK